jgi:hypothetical protein
MMNERLSTGNCFFPMYQIKRSPTDRYFQGCQIQILEIRGYSRKIRRFFFSINQEGNWELFLRKSDENNKYQISFFQRNELSLLQALLIFFCQTSNRNACLLSEIKRNRNNHMYFVILANWPFILIFNSVSFITP